MKKVLWMLVLGGLIVWRVGGVWAQVREDAEVLLAPALEVFAGQGTGQEIWYVLLVVVGGGFVAALLGIHLMWLTQRITVNVLVRFLGVWVVFVMGAAAIGLTWYGNRYDVRVLIKADQTITPRDVRVLNLENELVVRWRTEEPTWGQLVFRTNVRNERVMLSSLDKVSEHEVRIPLRPDEERVWLRLRSNGIEYRDGGEELEVIVR